MLVLIAGITGTCGQCLARAALAKGHQVRGLGRSPGKLGQELADKLEGFVQSEGIYDLAALDRAVRGVDAIVCAYTYSPETVVDGQILLLRAAERAGVKIFHAASWNFDWTRNALGDHEAYDSFKLFAHHARLSSPLRPLYGFTGVMLEYWFLTTGRAKMIDRGARTVAYYGSGSEPSHYTSADDLAAYAVEAISAPGAENGGSYRVRSFTASPLEMAEIYGRVRGVELQPRPQGSLADCEAKLEEARREMGPLRQEEYIGYAYAKYMLNGTWDYDTPDSERWGSVKQTSFEEWLRQHPEA